MHMIGAGGLHGKGFGGHADSVFNEKQGRNQGNTLLYARTSLLQTLTMEQTSEWGYSCTYQVSRGERDSDG